MNDINFADRDACTSPQTLFLVRGWGLGMRLCSDWLVWLLE